MTVKVDDAKAAAEDPKTKDGFQTGIAEHLSVKKSKVTVILTVGKKTLRRRLETSQILNVAYKVVMENELAATKAQKKIMDKAALKTALDKALNDAKHKVLEIQDLPSPTIKETSDATILKFSLPTCLLILVNLLA